MTTPAGTTPAESAGTPLEVSLAVDVRRCRACTYLWPTNGPQPYGPFPTFDLTVNDTGPTDPPGDVASFEWQPGITRAPGFPDPEVMDGCRKAPIMTIGINPNLTAFAPGPTGAQWAYPSFASEGGTDEWAKYASYYRYRSIYQERFDLAAIQPYLLSDGQVRAERAGVLVSADRPTDAPSYTVHLRYDGDTADTAIPLRGVAGEPRWVVLVAPHARFYAGDPIASKLDMPAGQPMRVYRQRVGYYHQFTPVLAGFEAYLRQRGYAGRPLMMGEDVGQLDMVACASPHWNPGFLGGTAASEQHIIDNCVSANAWALKQLVQTNPAVLYLVGEASYTMFRRAFGGLLRRDPPLDNAPADGAFTLLRETTDPLRPCHIEIDAEIDGVRYELRTRLVVTPHFSYDSNFVPQVRLSPSTWAALQEGDPACAWALSTDPRITVVPGAEPRDYVAFVLAATADAPGGEASAAAGAVLAELTARFPGSARTLLEGYVDAHALMGATLVDLYAHGALAVGPAGPTGAQVLTRTAGGCRFCVNENWTLAAGCPYGKPDEPAPPAGFLARVATEAARAGRVAPAGADASVPSGVDASSPSGVDATPGTRRYADQHAHVRRPAAPARHAAETGRPA